MFESFRREVVGRTLMDFAKVLLGGHLASGFFATLPIWIRLALFLTFVLSFFLGWWCSPPKKGGL